MSNLKKIIIGIVIALILSGGGFYFWMQQQETVELMDYYEADLNTLIEKTGIDLEYSKTMEKLGEIYGCKERNMMIAEGDNNRIITVKYREDCGKIPFSICNIRQGMTREEVLTQVPKTEGYAFGLQDKLQEALGEGNADDLGDYFFDLEREYELLVQYKNNVVDTVHLQRMDELWKGYFNIK